MLLLVFSLFDNVANAWMNLSRWSCNIDLVNECWNWLLSTLEPIFNKKVGPLGIVKQTVR